MPGMQLELRVPSTHEARHVARHSIEEVAESVAPDRSKDLGLLVHELVCNSLRHGELQDDATIEVALRTKGDVFHIEVADPGVGFEPDVRPPGPLQSDGMGLFFVDRLADRWGVRTDSGTRVWFEIDVADGLPPAD